MMRGRSRSKPAASPQAEADDDDAPAPTSQHEVDPPPPPASPMMPDGKAKGVVSTAVGTVALRRLSAAAGVAKSPFRSRKGVNGKDDLQSVPTSIEACSSSDDTEPKSKASGSASIRRLLARSKQHQQPTRAEAFQNEEHDEEEEEEDDEGNDDAALLRREANRSVIDLRAMAAAQGNVAQKDDRRLDGSEHDHSAMGPPGALSKDEVTKDESRLTKFIVRMVSGGMMVTIFSLFLYMGHPYICALIALIQLLLFRELVRVRYNTYFHIIKNTVPLFRTTQWMWFLLSIFYTYSDFVVEVIKSNANFHPLMFYAKWQAAISLCLYSGTFVLTIATLQRDHIKFQLNQLTWTIVVIGLTVGQLKYIMHNVYNGLIWFNLPVSLVITNDVFAYFCGMTMGRKFFQRPFLSLSPNKTWEGFIGAWFFTMIIGWQLAGFMAKHSWFTCPTNEFVLVPQRLVCEEQHIFRKSEYHFPPQLFDVLPHAVSKLIPGVREVCAVNGDPTALTACISGETSHTHHHFDLVWRNVYPIQIHSLALSMFASLVAPFGGFLASGIKRAYGIKNFDSIIPGHGGLMDRMDCQFLMALYTWVHYNTFVKMSSVSVAKMLYMYKLLSENERAEFLEKVAPIAASRRR